MKILFWNTNGNDINDVIKEVIIEHQPEIIGLAEYRANETKLLKLLYDMGKKYFYIPTLGCERIRTLCQMNPKRVEVLYESSYYIIRRFPDKKIGDINIAFVHFPVMHISENDKIEIANNLREMIEKKEREFENKNTVIIGDFNMNPFDKGMYGAMGLHATPYSVEALKISRIIREVEKFYFYNPIWSILGDSTEPFGSYYYRKATNDSLFWHYPDQIIIRPELIKYFKHNNLKWIMRTKTYKLLKDHKPNNKISDHLPIFFEI